MLYKIPPKTTPVSSPELPKAIPIVSEAQKPVPVPSPETQKLAPVSPEPVKATLINPKCQKHSYFPETLGLPSASSPESPVLAAFPEPWGPSPTASPESRKPARTVSPEPRKPFPAVSPEPRRPAPAGSPGSWKPGPPGSLRSWKSSPPTKMNSKLVPHLKALFRNLDKGFPGPDGTLREQLPLPCLLRARSSAVRTAAALAEKNWVSDSKQHVLRQRCPAAVRGAEAVAASFAPAPDPRKGSHHGQLRLFLRPAPA
ncbi:hypothetical protein QTO34_016660 [Cnephaeus nilssonii]|uniref:Uncharacterized protein n=1 Tax=Cnephaeus nilssonii TaxID=3371016 RepID=A0AA40LSC5_CNENI|nr:hypothetical protein QTO34_016660 [Eptesicus nilssonii]